MTNQDIINNVNILSDIWTSKDGKVWNDVTELSISPYSPRRNFKIVNVHDILLYLVGGINDKLEVLNDVWKSKDGLNWELVTSKPEFSPRLYFTLTYFNNQI